MAAQNTVNMQDIPSLLKDAEAQGFYLEEKYDGERVQIHRQGTEYQLFSR